MSMFINIRKALTRLVLLGAMGVLLPLPLNAADEKTVSVDGLTAEMAVEKYIHNLLQQIEQIKPLYTSNRSDYFTGVDKALSDLVDFREVARGVMAKYGTGPKGATAEQLEHFSDVFRASLVDFYGSALAGYGAVGFEILPARKPAENPAQSSNVRMIVESDDGSRFEIQYTMFLNEEQVWKLKNLYVEGVNLRRQYYAQFDSLMMKYDFDIDDVIEHWQSAE